MSSRIDAVSQRVQQAVTTQKVTNSMQGVVRSMEAAMKSMDLEKISKLVWYICDLFVPNKLVDASFLIQIYALQIYPILTKSLFPQVDG